MFDNRAESEVVGGRLVSDGLDLRTIRELDCCPGAVHQKMFGHVGSESMRMAGHNLLKAIDIFDAVILNFHRNCKSLVQSDFIRT